MHSSNNRRHGVALHPSKNETIMLDVSAINWTMIIYYVGCVMNRMHGGS